MIKQLVSFLAFWVIAFSAKAQLDATLCRFPDVSANSIVFAYANDLWIMPKNGGEAVRLSSPAGTEFFPKFSPDGSMIAFSGNYDGNIDVYVMPSSGGVPKRLTSHGYGDRMIDWTPDGKSIIFASSRESGKSRFNQFYQINVSGGSATKLPLGIAEYGSLNADGSKMAVVFITQVGRTWKRYKGGTKGAIHIVDLKTGDSKRLSNLQGGGDEYPMWYGDFIYCMSDRGSEERMNLSRYNVNTGTLEQLTHYKDYDIHNPSLGRDEIVYVVGGKLHLFNLKNNSDKTVDIKVTTDEAPLKPKLVNTSDLIQNVNLSPDGKRVLIEARGDIYSLPAEEGVVLNLTQSTSIAERYPSWSPDGKSISYWSDLSGEYELWIKDMTSSSPAKKMTSYGPGYRHQTFWSPDSKKLAYVDKAGEIFIYNMTDGSTTKVDEIRRVTYGPTEYFSCHWSKDSRWLTYDRDLPNQHSAVFLFDLDNKKRHQITNGFYSYNNPVFDESGKYLFMTTNQSFNPIYSDFDNTWIYSNSTQIAVATLRKDSTNFLSPVNDTVAITKEEPEKVEDKKEDKSKKNTKTKKEETEAPKKDKKIQIDLDGLESRIQILDLKPGNYWNLEAVKGKLLFVTLEKNAKGNTSVIKYFDFNKKEAKTIIEGVGGYTISADGKKLLINQGGKWAVIDPSDNAKVDKTVPTNGMIAMVDPRAEWRQIFIDAWRIERDFFYDPNMHGVDWNGVKDKYLRLVDQAATREDVGFIIGEMIGELNASHTYYGGGDVERTKSVNTGYLGVNWVPDGEYYKVGEIIKGAEWDAEARSPLDRPGVKIKKGDYILAVNGLPITTQQEPFMWFTGLANKTVELTYNSTPTFQGAKKQIIETMDDEYRLRNLAWIEQMRDYVDKKTNGEVGYIYVPSTGQDGQIELMRMFNAQIDKKALIIDERFNNGGQIPDRFIEMLDRKPLVHWATRDGEPWQWPPTANFGPKVMLINGWSGSGGDAFPDYFRKRGLGPLVGSRTWGGLIGISGAPPLIDGASVTVPTFRMYNYDGTWFPEGHGVDPDYFVDENTGALGKGIDGQLDKAIEVILQLMKDGGYKPPTQPAYQKR